MINHYTYYQPSPNGYWRIWSPIPSVRQYLTIEFRTEEQAKVIAEKLNKRLEEWRIKNLSAGLIQS